MNTERYCNDALIIFVSNNEVSYFTQRDSLETETTKSTMAEFCRY